MRGALRKLLLGLAIAAAMVVALTSCSIFGGSAVGQQRTTAANLANQKAAALKFLSSFPEAQRIEFTREGGDSGAGYWAANAVVTIAGKEYLELIGPHVLGGDPLPDPEARPVPSPVTLIYSDGSSEVLG